MIGIGIGIRMKARLEVRKEKRYLLVVTGKIGGQEREEVVTRKDWRSGKRKGSHWSLLCPLVYWYT